MRAVSPLELFGPLPYNDGKAEIVRGLGLKLQIVWGDSMGDRGLSLLSGVDLALFIGNRSAAHAAMKRNLPKATQLLRQRRDQARDMALL